MIGFFARILRGSEPSPPEASVPAEISFPVPPIDHENADVGRTYGIHSVRMGGWHGVFGISARYRRIVFLLIDPEGFRLSSQWEMQPDRRTEWPTGDVLADYLRRECLRLTRGRVAGHRPELVLPPGHFTMDGGETTPHDLDRMCEGDFFYGSCVERTLRSAALGFRDNGLSSSLGHWIPGNGTANFLRRPRGAWMKQGYGSSFVNRSVYEAGADEWTSTGSTRPGRLFVERPLRDAIHEAVKRRPWLAGLCDDDLVAIVRGSAPGDGPKDVATARNSRKDAVEPWSAAAVACMDRHVGAPPFRRPRDGGWRYGDNVELRRQGSGCRPEDGDPRRWCPEAFVSLLSALPPSWMPRDRESFDRLVRISAAVFSNLPWEDVASIAALLSRSKGDWRAVDAIVSPDAGRRLVDAADMVRFVATGLVVPSLQATGRMHERFHETALRTATLLACGNGGLPALLAASDAWHARQGFLPVLGTVERSWWSVPAQGLRREDGPSLVFLSDAKALEQEGRDLGHCVGSYARACATGSTQIASVRNIVRDPEDGSTRHVSLSTVEIRFVDGRPSVRQHRGRGNGDPPREAVAVLDEWLRGVADGGIKTSPGGNEIRQKAPTAVAFSIPDVGTPADWRGVLRGRALSGSWHDLAREVAAVFDLVTGGKRFAPDEGIEA